MTGASETGTWASRPRVTYTAQHFQLVRMGLEPGGKVGANIHTPNQFFRVDSGAGEATLDDVRTPIRAGFAVPSSRHAPTGRPKDERFSGLTAEQAAVHALARDTSQCRLEHNSCSA